jgi:hypothetical protein
MGLRPPTGVAVVSNLVQVTYSRPFFGLAGRVSPTISSLSWKMSGSASLAGSPITAVRASWNGTWRGSW